MISFFVLLLATVVAGRPNVAPLNVVTVPPNCPDGQQWVNGQCRDIWYIHSVPRGEHDNLNVITVPTNCPAGQEWINGACRDVWRSLRYAGSLPTENEADRMVWRSLLRDLAEVYLGRRVIKVPDLVCPEGYRKDSNGECRKRF